MTLFYVDQFQAPQGMKVEVLFDDFHFAPEYDGDEKHNLKGKCLHEHVEIRRDDDIYNGEM